MRYLVVTTAPAHVHLYGKAVRELVERGHDVRVLGPDEDRTRGLLEEYDLPHALYGTGAASPFGRLAGVVRHARAFDPDLVFGRNGYATLAGTVGDASTILVVDSRAVPHRLSTAFADVILSPNAFDPEFGDHHYRFRGLIECAYLHPEVRDVDPAVRNELAPDDDPYAIVDLDPAGHPIERERVIRELADEVSVVVTDDGDQSDLPARRFDLHPARLPDAIAGANLVVATTPERLTEAALLGTPAIGSLSPRDETPEFRELIEEGLAHVVGTTDEALDLASDLVADETATERWSRRRDEFLRDRVNLTRLLVDVAEQPEDVETITEPTPRVPAMK